MRTFATLALVLVGATLSVAQSPVGTWKGKLNIKFPPMPAGAPPEQAAAFAKAKDQIAKASFLLNIKADKSFVFTSSGLPMGAGQKQEGTWATTGKSITIKSKPDPKKPSGQPPMTGTISTDGKTITFPLPGGQGTMTFKK